jgi:NADH dehydrogenase [ubiquinone] 1 alpha subcomplex assembly factor 7
MTEDTGLIDHLKRRIAVEGSLSVGAFMAEALGHPQWGYYMSGEPFGADGDFVTAPEISQMFGELIGLWCAQIWTDMGRPDPVLLVELGPGRGTLMRDALRAARVVPDFRSALRVHLVETSPALRRRQAEALADAGPIWHDRIDTLPNEPILVIANEFFDALPIRQYQKTAHGWTERKIDIDPDSGGLRFVLDPRRDPVAPTIPDAVRDAPEGGIFELCPAAQAIAHDLGARLAAHGGAALVVDYGHARSAAGETLQSLRQHRFVPVLDDPGKADLTAHVDFEALADAARAGGAAVHGPVEQGAFLVGLGIRERAAMLKRNATADQAADIVASLERLIGTDAMGTLFKVQALTDPRFGIPAGFPVS